MTTPARRIYFISTTIALTALLALLAIMASCMNNVSRGPSGAANERTEQVWSPIGGEQYSMGVPSAAPADAGMGSFAAAAPSAEAAPGSPQTKRYEQKRASSQSDEFDLDRYLLPASSAMSPGDELWVIQRNSWGDPIHASNQPRPDNHPGCGSLICIPCPPEPGQPEPGQPEPGQPTLQPTPMVLEQTDYLARVRGVISSVELRQRFSNPISTRVEAVYVFPMPDDAAVSGFVMTIGQRTIRAVIREREEAEKIYQEAKAKGHRASLLTQERSNIFTQKVANIEPGEAIDVSITYFHTAAYRSGTPESPGAFELVIPLTIGPRFNPPSIATSGVNPIGSAWDGATSRGDWNNDATVTYERPGERSGRDVSIALDLDAGSGGGGGGGGVRLTGIESPSHAVDVRYDDGSSSGSPNSTRAYVRLQQHDRIANRDFVLRYRLQNRFSEQPASSVALTGPSGDGGEGYFSMVLMPPADLASMPRRPVEVVFVVDTSGSMKGEPIELCKLAAKNVLAGLRPGDRFQIVRFSDKPDALFDEPAPVTEANIRRGMRGLDELQAGGGTMMEPGIRLALGQNRSHWNGQPPQRFVWFLTDGFIGNEPDVLRVIRDCRNDASVFSVGVGSSPNRTLMNAMARLGKGGATYLASPEDAQHIAGVFLAQACAPAMTDVRIDFDGMSVDDVYPPKLPELRADRPVMVVGRYRGRSGEAPSVCVSGLLDGRRVSTDIAVSPAGGQSHNEQGGDWNTAPASRAIAQIWARTKLQDLDDRSNSAGAGANASGWGSKSDQIRSTALRFGLLSAYTAFIAVDTADKTAGWGQATTVNVPTDLPAGTDPSTTMPRPPGTWR